MVYPKIRQRQIEWPKETELLDQTTKSIIDALIQLKPEDRLGMPQTDHDMKKLMAHPYFSGIKFDTKSMAQMDIG